MHTNRLAREKSPYLLQHAHNPVDWYPWGEEAFEKAARENKPVFLSIGYSTCHWCHVMERESFENAEIARVLNENFVSIKVDREERPDVDRVYMLFVQASTGSGGWPMSVFLTPDKKPFFGGTYFPPDNRYGRPGFAAILTNLARAWREERARVEESGANVMRMLAEYAGTGSSGRAERDAIESGFMAFRRIFDPVHGGFGGAPKFPRPSVHNFLVRYHAVTGNQEALEMVLATLRAMAKGGMNDQLGGGFHRYSVDERWFVPHFEKMLYDQAQLAISYLEAFQITRDGQYASAARDIFSYVLRDMSHPDGGFFSAEDADSADESGAKREGAFYVWKSEEIDAELAPDDAKIFKYRFGVEPEGNVEEDPHGEFEGRNILYQAHTVEETALVANARADDVRAILRSASAKLLDVRATRKRPHLDDKILAGWNALMISAFARGAQILDEPRYGDAARGAANFIRRRMWDPNRRVLMRRHRENAAIEGFLDDYAFLAAAMLDLYETDFDSADLQFAVTLAECAMERFEDRENGGFFSTAAGDRDLILRLKDDYDGAEPSGNSVMALVLARLARMTDREDFRRAASLTIDAFGGRLHAGAAGLPQMLVAVDFITGRPREIVLAGPRDQAFRSMLGEIRRKFLPAAVMLRAEDVARPMPPLDGAATAYVCENYACQLPVKRVEELAEQLQ
jgi:uncharacterized protein